MQEFEQRTLDKLNRDLGPELAAILSDTRTIEVVLNPDGRLWLERLDEPMRCVGRMDRSRAEGLIKTLASHLGQEVTRSRPLLEGELPPDGARFAGQLPPVVEAPTFSIRKPTLQALRLADYVAQGALKAEHCDVLLRAINAHRNILVVGGTGSGKTTFVNALIAEMTAEASAERLIVLEDTREIRCAADNCVQYRSTAEVSMSRLLRTTLRMRPDRIIVGEVRGPEALDLLMAWNTGHEGGAATLHANSTRAGLLRLEMLVSMAPEAPRPIAPLVAETVDVVLFIARTSEGRIVREVLEVTGLGAGGYETRSL